MSRARTTDGSVAGTCRVGSRAGGATGAPKESAGNRGGEVGTVGGETKVIEMAQHGGDTPGYSEDETAPFERLAVLGLGLLGGSVALAARRRGVARRVVGAARRRGPLEQALADGVVDEIGDAVSAVAGADLVVLATPVSSMGPLLADVSPHLASGALVTDVGSVKGPLDQTLPDLIPTGVCFIGSHPMAGSHLKGVQHANEGLFEGSCCVVTPTPDADPLLTARLMGFWRQLGCRVVVRTPGEHDDHAAWVSHVPHLIAYAFANALGAAPRAAAELRGSGFRDFTRIARSDVQLWGDILSANEKALIAPIREFQRALDEVQRALEAGEPEALEHFLSSARKRLAEFEGSTEEEPSEAADGSADRAVEAQKQKKKPS